MSVKLNEAMLDSLVPSGRDQYLFDTVIASFGYRLTPAGKGIYVVGRNPRRTVGFRPALRLTEARELAAQMLVDIRLGRDPKATRRTQATANGHMLVAQLIDKWLNDHVTKLKPRIAADYKRLVAQHIRPALGHLPVQQVIRDDVVQLHLAMKHTPRQANYVVTVIHAIFNFAEDFSLRPHGSNPAKRIKRYREGKVERFLTEDEIAKVADGIDVAERIGKIGPHVACGLRLALFTGARSGEITAIQWSHVDWERKFIRLPDSKTNEPRTIHLSDAAIEVLRSIPRSGPYVVAGAIKGEPFKNLWRAWTIVRTLAGLSDVRLHDLRHSYASLAAGRGVSLQMIGKLLGHKVPATTQRYAHLARDAVAAVNDELSAVMQAAIEKAPVSGSVVKLRRRRR
jgi:integrase